MPIVESPSHEQIACVRELFVEYANALGVDLCFQGFERELAELPGRYAPPSGRLLLALEGAEAAGCVALREIGDGLCEMKRLYVRPVFRRNKLGRTLAAEIIAAARAVGYERMRLDTLSSMKVALQLYESLGFRRIAPYYHNPAGDAVFLELVLRPENPRQAGAVR
jgi:putative acetyltransferase